MPPGYGLKSALQERYRITSRTRKRAVARFAVYRLLGRPVWLDQVQFAVTAAFRL
jgi:hypothetical protein